MHQSPLLKAMESPYYLHTHIRIYGVCGDMPVFILVVILGIVDLVFSDTSVEGDQA